MTTPLTITLDWKAYYLAFEQAHGGNPVKSGGRLLFADGWTYSASDHAGPEWPPPRDAERLRRLQAAYWRARRSVVRGELETLRATLEGLDGLARLKSVPLHHVIRLKGEDGRTRAERVPLELGEFQGRLDWLSDDLADCEAKLAELESPQEGQLTAINESTAEQEGEEKSTNGEPD